MSAHRHRPFASYPGVRTCPVCIGLLAGQFGGGVACLYRTEGVLTCGLPEEEV